MKPEASERRNRIRRAARRPGISSPSFRGQTYQDSTDFAPRIGIAFQATDRLVVRAGYGISYSRSFTDPSPNGNDGFSVTTPWIASQASDGITPGSPLSNPYPNGLDPVTGSADGLLTRVGNSVTAWRTYNPTPYLQSYSLDLQYQLGYGTVFEIGYTGTSGASFRTERRGDTTRCCRSTSAWERISTRAFPIRSTGP